MTTRTTTSHQRATRLRRTAISTLLATALLGGTAAVAEADAPATAVGPQDAGAISVVGLREGAEGPGVLAVQQRLIAMGYYVSGGADGHFGAGTTAALRVFQEQNGLNPTGVVTENTAKYLGMANGATAAPTPASPATPAAPAAAAAPSSTTTVVGLRRGASGAQVRALQERIVATGLVLAGGVDGTFGSSTERAVKLVQRVNGLPETGVVDARTAQALGITGGASSPSTPAPAGTIVQYGAQGAAVKRIQQLLIAAGVGVPGGADGIFGSRTRAAVRTFQQSKGLPVTGAVDAATDSALVTASSGGGGTPTTPPAATGYVGLRMGSVGPAVKKMQEAILATGLFLRGGADGVFGQGTHNALVIYQRVNGLNANGVVDDATARLMGLGSGGTTGGGNTGGGGPTAPGFAVYDEQGPRVVALQRALIAAGIPVPGGADGRFGSGTAGAVMKFQRAKGLRVTGRVDADTAKALGLSASNTPTPAPSPNIRLQAKPVGGGRCWYGDTWHAPRGGGRVHLGVDIGGSEGTPLQAVVTGRIIQIYSERAGSLAGNGLKIAMADGTYFFYAHLQRLAPGMAVGVPVTAGQVIGYMGHTGNAGITHLHFEVHPGGGAAVNPYPIVKATGAC